MKSMKFGTPAGIAALIVVLLGQTVGIAQTKVKPGVDFFSWKQEISMGRRSSEGLERRMAIVNDPAVQDWIDQLGHKLAAATTKPDLPWRFRVVNSSELNAFSLPGGFIYVNKGLIELTDSESEVAGAMAHEMAHVTLRHATNQMTKGMLLGGPFALGGPVGAEGFDLTFLKFSRNDETQADIVGAQTMVKAGYDPQGLVRLFQKLDKKQANCCGPEFLSDHGDLGDRIKRIEKEIGYLKVQPGLQDNSQQYVDAKARLQAIKLPAPPPPPEPIARGPRPPYPAPNYPPQNRPPDDNAPPGNPGNPDNNAPQNQPPRGYPPSSRPGAPSQQQSELYRSPDGFYEVEYPVNWRPLGSRGRDTMIAAYRGFNRGNEIDLGVVIGYFDLQSDNNQSPEALGRATDEAIKRVTANNNSYLTEEPNSRNQGTLSGHDAMGSYLVGKNHSGQTERDWLIVGPGGRGFVYLFFVSSDSDFANNQPTFEAIIESFRLNEGHFGAPRGTPPPDQPAPVNPADRFDREASRDN